MKTPSDGLLKSGSIWLLFFLRMLFSKKV